MSLKIPPTRLAYPPRGAGGGGCADRLFGTYAEGAAAETGAEQLGEVDGGTAGIALFDLGAATESIGQHNGALVGGADPRQQNALSCRSRNVIVAAPETEIAGQSATTRGEPVGMNSGPPHQICIGPRPQNRVLVAMRLNDRVHVELRWLPVGGPFGDHLGQSSGLLGQPAQVLFPVQQFGPVGAKHREAGRLQPDDWSSGANLVAQDPNRTRQHAAGHIELAGGDPGQSTAHRLARHSDLETGRL